MPKNRKRGEVDLPGFQDCFLRFDLAALEQLEAAFGDDWLPGLHDKLGLLNLDAIKTCIGAGAHGGVRNEDGTLDMSPLGKPGGLSGAVDAILDAVSLAVFDKTHKEALEAAEDQEIERTLSRLKKIEENPRAAAAFLRDLGVSATEQDSVPPKSEDSPQ